MSKYDDERKKILERMQSGNVSFDMSTASKYADERSPGKSKYAAEREALYNPPEKVGIQASPTFKGTNQPLQPMVSKTNYKKLGQDIKAKEYAADENRKIDESKAPGFIKSYAKFMNNALTDNPVGKFVNRISRGAGNALGIDLNDANAVPETSTGNRFIDKTADVAGAIGGTLTNPSNIGQGLASAPYRVGQQVAQRFAPRVAPIAQRAIEGSTAGAIQGGVISGVRGETSIPELATNIGLGAATGGVADPLLYGLGRGISNLFKRNGIPEQQAQEVLALPMGRQDAARMRSVNAPGTEPIVTPYTFGLPEGQMPRRIDVTPQEPLGLPSPRIEPPTRARVEQQANPYRQQFESLISRARQLEADGKLTPGREDEDLRSLWSQMAGPDSPSLDELIDLAYKTRPNRMNPNLVNQARQTQYSREVAGAPLPVKSQSDRYVQGPVSNVDSPVTIPRGVQQPRYGVFDEAARLQSKVGRAPGVPARQPEVLNSGLAPTRPRIDVTPEQEVEQIVQSVKQPRVRDRVYSYLDEAEKAARERIKARKGRLSSTPVDEWADYGIIGAAKLGKGSIKFADWTEEMVKEFGEGFRPKSQRVYNAAKEELKNQERRASKEGQAAEAFNNGAGDATTFDQKVSRNVNKKKTPFGQRWEKIRTQFVDDMAALEGVEKRVRGRVGSAEDSLYKTARLFKGTPEKANQIVRDRLSPVVDTVERSGYTADDLGKYALAVHAKDVNAVGYKSGFTNAEIADVIRKYGTPEMETARKDLVQINKDMLKEMVDSGVVSRELADVLDKRWKNYIPLFRSFDDDMVGFSGGLSGALANVASPIKGLKGSERAVIDPLENMVKNIFQSVNAAERNKVGTQLANLAKSDNEEKFIRKLGPDEQVGRKNVVNVKVNGENVKYEVEPEVYKAMLNLDQESSNMLINVLSKPASLLRAGATLTPEFSLRNPMRDVLQAFVTSKSGFNPIKDFTVGLVQSIKKGDLYKDWVDNLGAYGNIISQDRDVHRQALAKVLKQPASKKFVNIINGKGLINVLRAISDTTESATKVGEYRAALRQGQSKAEAAYRSRDLMDFARAGSSVRQANKVIAFLNANIQGKSKLIRAIKENPVGTLTRAFTSVTLPTVGIYAMNHAYANSAQKETIKEAPDWQKDSFWLIAVPGTDVVARIPKPFDLAPIFANLPEKALQFTQENDPQAFDGYVQRTLKSGALPAQISGLLPLIEGMSNYSFFREGDIIPMREQNMEFRDQYDPIRTTETAKLLAAGANKLTGGKGAFKNFSSPRIMDNTVKGLTAGLGTYATSAIDTILQGVGAVDRPKSPDKRLEQRPLAKAFLVDPLQGGKSMDMFYQNREKLQNEKTSADINERAFTKEPVLKYLNRVSDAMSQINKQIRNIESSDLSAADKRRQIDPLIQQRNQLAKDAVKAGNLK